LLAEAGNHPDFVKIVDFGIAKIMPGSVQESVSLTQTGELFGTPLYMSPEQCQGMEVDQRTDIYSMGCVMYEALTGRPPFSAQNSARLMYSQIADLPKPFSNQKTSNKKQLRALENIVLRCLEKDAALRYQSMDDLLAALNLAKQGRQPASSISQAARRRQKLLRFALFCAVGMPLLLISYFIYPLFKNTFFPPPWVQTVTAAEVQMNINEPRQAEALLKSALRQADGKANASDEFKIYYDLGNVYLNTNQYVRAVDAFKSALPFSRATPDPLSVANTLELIAYSSGCTHYVNGVFVPSQQALQDCRHGIELATEALKIKESQVGPEHPYLSYTLAKRAWLHAKIGDYEGAALDWRRAFEIDKKSPTTRVKAADDLESLAKSFKAAGKKTEAGESYRQAIELGKEVYGPDSTFVQNLSKESSSL
jgi:tetratricopeptide (TPR) repeat protein